MARIFEEYMGSQPEKPAGYQNLNFIYAPKGASAINMFNYENDDLYRMSTGIEQTSIYSINDKPYSVSINDKDKAAIKESLRFTRPHYILNLISLIISLIVFIPKFVVSVIFRALYFVFLVIDKPIAVLSNTIYKHLIGKIFFGMIFFILAGGINEFLGRFTSNAEILHYAPFVAIAIHVFIMVLCWDHNYVKVEDFFGFSDFAKAGNKDVVNFKNGLTRPLRQSEVYINCQDNSYTSYLAEITNVSYGEHNHLIIDGDSDTHSENWPLYGPIYIRTPFNMRGKVFTKKDGNNIRGFYSIAAKPNKKVYGQYNAWLTTFVDNTKWIMNKTAVSRNRTPIN